MGARGRAPTPTPILKLRGSWRAKAREKQGAEPQPESGQPTRPERLADDEAAVWLELCGMLERMQLLFVADGWQLERYAVFFARWRKVEAVIRKFSGSVDMLAGAFAKDDVRPIIRAAMAESRNLDAQLKQIEGQFGLTPSARTRIKLMDRLGEAASRDAAAPDKKRFFGA